ncbi:hypothetical protein [Brevibacillus sp. SYSU BS000544]|uniref:hypothetical protein n=1 Tax=Brevibacillus sp. SYSU BS000544 TaxID=3416443 RepID=UPI003CE46CD2
MRVIAIVIMFIVIVVLCTACGEQNNIITPNYSNNKPTNNLNSKGIHTEPTKSNQETKILEPVKNILGEWKIDRIFAHGKGAKYTDDEMKDNFIGKTVIYSVDSMKFGDQETLKPIYYQVSEPLDLLEQLRDRDFSDLPKIDNDTLKMITIHENKSMDDIYPSRGSVLYITNNNELLLLEGGNLLVLVKK